MKLPAKLVASHIPITIDYGDNRFFNAETARDAFRRRRDVGDVFANNNSPRGNVG